MSERLVGEISAHETHDLRHRYLRPEEPMSAVDYAEDGNPGAIHFGYTLDGRLVGVASLYHEPSPVEGGTSDWRLRGMVVEQDQRGGGIGRALIDRCIEHIAPRGGRRIWCNARMTVSRYYEQVGFAGVGDVFELPRIGPHRLMVRELDHARV